VTSVDGYSLLTQAVSTNNAFFFIWLNPWHHRFEEGQSAKGIVQRLNARFAQELTEGLGFAFGPPAIPGLGNGGGYSMMLQDKGGNPPEYLEEQAQVFIRASMKRPEVGGAMTLYRASVPQFFADINNDKALAAGITLADVQSTLGAFLGGSYVNDFNRFGRLYKVYLQAEGEYRNQPEDIDRFFVKNSKGEMVSLGSLVSVRSATGPDFTNRFNVYRAAEIIGASAPGYSSTQTLSALKEVAAAVLPPDIGYEWNALSYQEERAAGTGTVVFVLGILFVFLILAAQYESWSLPFSVMLGTPFAIGGAFFGIWLCRFMSPSYLNNIFAQIGLLMLVGLAAKNAILIVEYARMKTSEGLDVTAAALDAAQLRFRPILMTAFSFILGVIPLLIATGAGAEGRKVMGVAVFSGMLVATIVGVCVTPMLFILIERIANRKSGALLEHSPDSNSHEVERHD
jgi:HAE1 family hydrophobic/amphiphilic exporter-1